MKRNYKRFLALCISAGLCVTSLAGCGTQAVTNENEQQETKVSSEEQKTETDAVDLTEAVFPLPTEAEPADIYVEPIPDISDDFIRGMDASAVLAEENSGV